MLKPTEYTRHPSALMDQYAIFQDEIDRSSFISLQKNKVRNSPDFIPLLNVESPESDMIHKYRPRPSLSLP
jgi:hypothetical protein